MLNIILFGPPGSGKGTHSIKLAEKMQLYHLSTGDIFRSEISNKTLLGIEAKQYIDKGALVPDDLVIKVLLSTLEKQEKAKGFIFDGFPRTLIQAQKLDEELNKKGIPIKLIISLEVNNKEIITRLVKRGLESGRSDDNEEIIKQRLAFYNKQTAPLLEYYSKQNKLYTIHGVGLIEEIFVDICKTINQQK
ncbi:MAG: adenylate kinase [Bacteroidetes bacterium CG2_30_32_10]|nr:MAG: adenylate kinase [Bacteroidetes bacterium CG2_30_32_10]